MTTLQAPARVQSATDVAGEFEGTISGIELRAILNAVKLVKDNGGWAEIGLVYKAGDLNDVTIYLTQKPEKPPKEV